MASVGSVDDAGPPISDAELTALALAADPDAPLDDDAVPFRPADGDASGALALLPAWYMPPIASFRASRRRRVAIAVLVGAFLAVSGAGLCVTYGLPEIAW